MLYGEVNKNCKLQSVVYMDVNIADKVFPEFAVVMSLIVPQSDGVKMKIYDTSDALIAKLKDISIVAVVST